MDFNYWCKKWQHDKEFNIENNRLMQKNYVFSVFPKAYNYGFQTLDIRKVLAGDIYCRYLRLNDKNVLYPLGYHSLNVKSFIENKKHSGVLNDDISNIFYKEMLKLGLSINQDKLIDMRHSEYMTLLQLSFIELYERDIIKYQNINLLYDKENNKITDDFKYTNYKKIERLSFCLDIKDKISDIVYSINNLKIEEKYKKEMLDYLLPKRVLEIDFNVSGGKKLTIKSELLHFLGGVSFIALHPGEYNFEDYVEADEYYSVTNYLSGNSNLPFAFTGLFASNPLTGDNIPIIISDIFNEAIHLGIPDVDSDDYAFVNEYNLEYKRIINNDKLFNSDFLDGVKIEDAFDVLADAFTEAQIAKCHITYERKTINLSSLDNFGPLFPFLEDKENNSITSLKEHLPYLFSSKLRPVLSSDVDIVGDSMTGSINNLFSEGMLSILSIIYDNNGYVTSIFSNEAINEFNSYSNIDSIYIGKKDLFPLVFMPIVLTNIIYNKKDFFNNIIIIEDTYDTFGNEILRSNSNLYDFEELLDKYNPDSIRLYFMQTKFNQILNFDENNLLSISRLLDNLEKSLINISNTDNLDLDYEIFNYAKDAQYYLENNDIVKYAKITLDILSKINNNSLSKKELLKLLCSINPILPYLSEEIYKKVFNSGYSINNLGFNN